MANGCELGGELNLDGRKRLQVAENGRNILAAEQVAPVMTRTKQVLEEIHGEFLFTYCWKNCLNF